MIDSSMVSDIVMSLAVASQVIVDGVWELYLRFDPTNKLSVSEQEVKATLKRDDIFGVKALGALMVLSKGNINYKYIQQENQYEFDEYFKLLSTLYLLENITDDICYIEENDGQLFYPHAGFMRDFYTLLASLTKNQITLYEAYNYLAESPAVDVSTMSLKQFGNLFNVTSPSYFICALELTIVADILSALQVLADKHPELKSIVVKAHNGLLARYEESRASIETPQVNIEQAIQRGKATILTDFHYAFMLLTVASLSRPVHLALSKSMSSVLIAIDHCSYIIRILNDAGQAGIQPIRALEILQKIDNTALHMTSPRELIRGLQKFDLGSQQLFARLIKDVQECEANIILDVNPSLSTQSNEEFIHRNLMFANNQLCISSRVLEDTLPIIAHPYLIGLLANLIEFHCRMYTMISTDGGEWIKTDAKWISNTLRSILLTADASIFIGALLVQSTNNEGK